MNPLNSHAKSLKRKLDTVDQQNARKKRPRIEVEAVDTLDTVEEKDANHAGLKKRLIRTLDEAPKITKNADMKVGRFLRIHFNQLVEYFDLLLDVSHSGSDTPQYLKNLHTLRDASDPVLLHSVVQEFGHMISSENPIMEFKVYCTQALVGCGYDEHINDMADVIAYIALYLYDLVKVVMNVYAKYK